MVGAVVNKGSPLVHITATARSPRVPLHAIADLVRAIVTIIARSRAIVHGRRLAPRKAGNGVRWKHGRECGVIPHTVRELKRHVCPDRSGPNVRS